MWNDGVWNWSGSREGVLQDKGSFCSTNLQEKWGLSNLIIWIHWLVCHFWPKLRIISRKLSRSSLTLEKVLLFLRAGCTFCCNGKGLNPCCCRLNALSTSLRNRRGRITFPASVVDWPTVNEPPLGLCYLFLRGEPRGLELGPIYVLRQGVGAFVIAGMLGDLISGWVWRAWRGSYGTSAAADNEVNCCYVFLDTENAVRRILAALRFPWLLS